MNPSSDQKRDLSDNELAEVTGGAKKQAKKKESKPSGNDQSEYLTVTLTDVQISSY
jgi:bacteriocin-like protein